jgi:AraC-like DNA-binding protein
VYFDITARQPWVAASPPVTSICGKVMPGFDHVIAFHIMMDGWCWAQLADESQPEVRLEAGDAVVFVRGDAHFMSTEPGERAAPDFSMYYRPNDRPLPFIFNEFGGSGEKSRFVCGLQEKENPRAGGETILSRLSELMFLQAVREYIESLPRESTGWLAALRDRHIGAALRLMHGRPAEAWTLDLLAREVGLSRSVFAERFADVMGTPAMHYLGNWRLAAGAAASLAVVIDSHLDQAVRQD